MSRTLVWWFAAGAALLSWLGVGLLRRYAMRRGVLDRPNERSSHVVPTPRGGGLAVLAASVATFSAVASLAGALDWRLSLALLGIVPTAFVGWVDDHGGMSPRLRLLAHVVTGILVLPLALEHRPGFAALGLALVWLGSTVSAINVINFIDGIDGMIGLAALLFGAHLAVLDPPPALGGSFGLLLSAASAAFLLWNWAPARIFLGDVGSGSLAAAGLVAAILVWRMGTWSFLACFLPLFPLFLDAFVTIWRRARRQERIWEAHRSHLYQRLALEGGWGHARVTLLYGAAILAGSVTAVMAPSRYLPVCAALYAAGVAVAGWTLGRRIRASAAGSRLQASG